MFPEYRELIERIKADGKNQRALHLLGRHAELDTQIDGMSNLDAGSVHDEIDTLKREKLRVKDELLALLKAHHKASG